MTILNPSRPPVIHNEGWGGGGGGGRTCQSRVGDQFLAIWKGFYIGQENCIQEADIFKHTYGRFRERGYQLPSSPQIGGVVFECPDVICELSAAAGDTHD